MTNEHRGSIKIVLSTDISLSFIACFSLLDEMEIIACDCMLQFFFASTSEKLKHDNVCGLISTKQY